MADLNQEALNQIRATLRAYVKFGSSTPLDADGIVPAELFVVLMEVLGVQSPDQLPKPILDVLRKHDIDLKKVEANLTDDERRQLNDFWNSLKMAKNQKQLDAAEKSKENLDDNVQKAIDKQRRLRQSIATMLLDAWKKANDESEPDEQDQDGEGSDDHSDSQDMDEPSEDDAEDSQSGEGEDGDDESDGDDGNGGGEDDGESDGSDGNGDGEPGEGEGEGQSGEGNGEPGEGKGKPGEGKGEPGEGQGEGSQGENQGEPGEGQSNGEGKPDSYEDQNSAEDAKPGHDEWMDQLEKEIEEQDQAEAEAEAEGEGDGDGDGDDSGDDGDGKGKTDTTDPNRDAVEGAFDLSDIVPDPAEVAAAKQALARMIAKGLDNPTQLPRWQLGEFVKRQSTWRNLKGAKRPTLERKAVLFIIDNSPSMARLEKQSRALAAALSATGGPGGADVIVALSSNGEYSTNKKVTDSQDGTWFMNGKFMGQLPKPSSTSGVDPRHNGYCWKWFIQKVLPRFKVNVHLIGVYGDYDGSKHWSFISNEMKGVQALWFNPENRELEGVKPHKNPVLTDKGFGSSYGYVQGDRRFEQFRGIMFTQVDTVLEIAMALRKVAGL